jgi:hypothetical protein
MARAEKRESALGGRYTKEIEQLRRRPWHDGLARMAIWRMTSAVTLSTVSMRRGSLLRSSQGAALAKYRLASATTAQTAPSA